MSFKFSLVTLAATVAVVASPLVASAQTLTPQRTYNNRHETIIDTQSSDEIPQTLTPQRTNNSYQTITNTQSNSERLVPNYIGVGGSNRGAALESKFALNNNFSIRPMAIDNLKSDDQNGDFSLPVTYDFQPVIGKLQPYAGGGLGVTAGDNSDLGAMLTAGADYPLNKSITANATVNYDAFGNNDVNGIVGVAANFGS